MIEPASRRVRVDDLTLRLLDFGGDGPPLLFSHATGFHAWVWAPYARRFRARWHVLALDHRGHGESDKPPSGYRWEQFGADLAGLLDALDLREVRAVGHSKGAIAIVVAAARTDRLVRAVLVEPVLIWPPPAPGPVVDAPLAVGARKRRMVWPSRQAMFDSLRARPPFDGWQEAFVRLYVDHGVADRPDGQVELRCPGDIEAQVYASAPVIDGFAALERCTIPTLLVRGEQSTGIGAREEAEVLRRLPHGSAVRIPHAGHFAPMEQPAAVMDAIERFFG